MDTNDLTVIQTTRISRDYVEKLPAAIALLSEPFQKIVAAQSRMRIIIDYDPDDQKVEFKYLAAPECSSTECP